MVGRASESKGAHLSGFATSVGACDVCRRQALFLGLTQPVLADRARRALGLDCRDRRVGAERSVPAVEFAVFALGIGLF